MVDARLTMVAARTVPPRRPLAPELVAFVRALAVASAERDHRGEAAARAAAAARKAGETGPTMPATGT